MTKNNTTMQLVTNDFRPSARDAQIAQLIQGWASQGLSVKEIAMGCVEFGLSMKDVKTLYSRELNAGSFEYACKTRAAINEQLFIYKDPSMLQAVAKAKLSAKQQDDAEEAEKDTELHVRFIDSEVSKVP